ncbi:unnamed protein product [Heterobilharzia americana]|nr:unnamed protein product [Heterobilharzia americana]
MDKCESDDQHVNKSSRVRYTRAEILEVKKNNVSSIEITDEFSRINASILRSARGRTKPNNPTKSQGERTRDTSSIILGPQKRTWNTGCHVSQQPPGRELSDTNAPTRWPKFSSDHRSSDKHHARAVTDHRKDYRSTDVRGPGHSVRGRDRGSSKHTEGIPFSKNYGKDDRYSRERRISNSHSEDEPEWFSEGPTTVNETIELGGILEESLECESDLAANNIEIKSKSEIIGGDKLVKANTSTANVFAQQPPGSKSGVFSEIPTKGAIGAAAPLVENQGSRFKHLFQKNESSDENTRPSNYSQKQAPLDSINAQLLKLLKGSCGDPSSLHSLEMNSALQVENKLRSILLGCSAVAVPSVDHEKKEFSESKPKVLTVEEIEAQLKSPHECLTDVIRPANTTVGSLPQISVPLLIDDQAIKSHGVPIDSSKNDEHFAKPETTSNLVSILQSLMIKTQHQRPICSQSMNIHNSSPFGLFSGPMADSVSASGRINQLQRPDMPRNLASDVGPPSQGTSFSIDYSVGFLRNLWDGTRDVTYSKPQLQSPALYPDLPRPQPFASGPPGRPIVKGQQNMFSSHIPGRSAGAVYDRNPMSIDSSIQQVSRRLLGMNLKQYHLGSNESSDLLNDSSGALSCHRLNYGNSFLYQNPSLSLPSTTFFNNISAYPSLASTQLQQQTIANSGRTNNDNLTLLSQLMEWERLKQPSGVNSTFSEIKAKTLEEIERLES